jgi:hypothetical protein
LLLALSRDFSDAPKTSSSARVLTQNVVPSVQSAGLKINRRGSKEPTLQDLSDGASRHGNSGSSVYSSATAVPLNQHAESSFAVNMQRYMPEIIQQLSILNVKKELSNQAKLQATDLERKHVSEREQWQVCFFSSPPAMT